MRRTLVLSTILLLGACTTNPVPKGYQGPLAYIRDSEVPRGGTGGDFFFVAAVGGKRIDDSLAATHAANYGQGFAMKPVVVGRNVPAGPSTFKIVGRTHYGAPILELVNKVYQVSGEATFTPLPDHSYVVNGVLQPSYSAVWIEEEKTGELVGQKIEVNGSATLGVLEK